MDTVIDPKISNLQPKVGRDWHDKSQWLLEPNFNQERTAWVLFEEATDSDLEKLEKVVSSNSSIIQVIVDRNAIPKIQKNDENGIIKIYSTDINDAVQKLSAAINRDVLDGWKPLITKEFAKISTSFVMDMMRTISEVFNSINMKKGTVEHISWKFVQNCLINSLRKSSYRSFEPIRGILKNKPAVIVSAGPSLNKQLPILKEYQDSVSIICVDSIWSVLIQNDIIPDVVVALDAVNIPKWTEDSFKKESILFVDIGCHVRMFNSTGTDEVVMAHLPQLTQLSAALGQPAAFIPSGGSVSTTAFTIAHFLDANPIIFIGQDLGYTDGQDHASGYQYTYDSNLKQERDNLGFDTEGYYGGRIRTERQFLHYKTWFEEVIKGIGESRIVINSTEGGAKISGALQIPFIDVCEELSSVYQAKPRLHEIANTSALEPKVARLESVENLRQRIINYDKLAEEGINICANSGSRVQTKKFKKIDRLNSKLLMDDILVKYIIDSCSNRNLEEIRKSAARSSEEIKEERDRWVSSLESYKKIYSQLRESCKILIGRIDKIKECDANDLEDTESLVKLWRDA